MEAKEHDNARAKSVKCNIILGILAHVDAGKTTLSEAILYKTGEIRKPGRVDRGDTLLDDNTIERNRGITIFSRQARFSIAADNETEGHDAKASESAGEPGSSGRLEVTLIDTPGHVDFAAETERSMSVLDYALLVISGSEGVQPHAKTLYRMLRERGIPVFVFVNKMDISVRAKESIIDEMRTDLGMNAVDFTKAAKQSDDFIDDVTLFSPELAEAALESDSANGCVLSDDMIAKAILDGEVVPCMFGSALKMEGIDELLEAIRRYTLSPEYVDEFGARVYKVADSDDGERLCFIKITGGELKVRDRVILRKAPARAGAESEYEVKINQIRLYSGSRCVTVDSAAAGTACAVTGLRGALPGDCIGNEMPLEIDEIKPFMVYSVSGPAGKDPHEIMSDLKLLSAEDPALSADWSRDGDSIEIRIMGQVQLEVLQAIIKERFGYEVSFDSGSVLYLETITDRYEGVGHFEPLRHYAEVHLIIEPGERGSGIVISSTVPEDELDTNWQRLIMTHLEEREHPGVITCSPITDVKICLAAGRAHDKHTVGGDFREATYRAIRNALMQARRDGNATLLEPWSEYEIQLPANYLGRAMADIKQMGGIQSSLEQTADTATIRGRVPSKEIAEYAQILTGYTSGEGSLGLTPGGYDICHDPDKVIAESGYDPERDVDNPADSVFVNHSGSDIVKWDEVKEHMHLESVIERQRRRDGLGSNRADSAGYSRQNASFDMLDVKEAVRRRAAAEKELRMIFERTYGKSKKQPRNGSVKTDFSKNAGLTEEEIRNNARRSEEIKARHAKKTVEKEDEPALILVDGYNLIFSDQYLKELAAGDIGSARDQLIERLCNYAGYTGCELALIFDAYNVAGATGSEENINGIRVIYTAEDETADIRMGLMTGSIKDRQIYVVSSDALVQQDALGHGAMRISSTEFTEMLSRTEQEIRDRLI